ncbi:hypothetical protein RB2083_1022 [Rhodobacteraceae bacterium HTCC2083]|nr:hypothetical protein RB2083_1022 [Rhodobacteraceae bacterium HTCC2083]
MGVGFDTKLGKHDAYYALYTASVAKDVKQELGLTFRVDF